ncbi:MAG: lipopolysaccharide heptosyltransferase II [bacterium]
MSRVLFRSPNWLGDAVMATAVPPALRRRHETVGILTPAAIADVWRAAPDVDEVVTFSPGGEVDAYRSAGYDRVLLGPVSFGSAWRALRGGVRERFGFGGECRDWLLSRRLPARAYSRDRHQVENYRELAGLAGRPEDADAPRLVPLADWRQDVPAIWPDARRPRVALQPGATYGPAKRWPADRFAAVGRALHERGLDVAVLGGPGDRAEVEAVLASAPDALDLGGRTTVGQLAAVLESADLLVTNDTGPMHLAAAVGTPVLAVFGSTSPRWTRPFGEGHRVITHPVPCQPCFRRDCRIGYGCLRGVETERVVAEVLAVTEALA